MSSVTPTVEMLKEIRQLTLLAEETIAQIQHLTEELKRRQEALRQQGALTLAALNDLASREQPQK